MKHKFMVCAYGDCEYLESCLKSLVNQSVQSEIVICTSTPSEYIEGLALKYDIPVLVNTEKNGIASDWNFAYASCDADLVTIAHQDDIYHHDYVKTLTDAKKQYPDMSVFMTSSVSIRNGKPVEWGGVEIVKKLLRTPLKFKKLADSSFIKKAALSFGNPVICPSCAYDKALCGEKLFSSDYKYVLDWDALLRLAEKKGRFVCIEKPLIMYRVHSESATAGTIKDGTRAREESEIFDRVLTKPFSSVVKQLYKISYDSYKE